MKVLKIIAWFAIGPAVYVNVEATSMPWTPFAIGSVIFAAVFISLTQARRSFWFGALGAVFILINLATALGNIATMSDENRDGRSSVIERKQKVDGKRAALNVARKVQVELAGEVPAQAIEGQLRALIASDAPRWTASGHCDPDKITQPATRSLCNTISQTQAKKAAALKRDEIDLKLAEVDKETVFGAPNFADPYAESLARLLTVFGFQVSDENRAILSSSKDWGKAIGLELMAAFGPMALTLLFEVLLDSHPVPVPTSNEGRTVVKHKPAPGPSIVLPAVTHLPVEAVPAALHIEAAADEPSEPAPLPQSPRKRTATKCKPEKKEVRPDNVIPFRKDVHKVHALLSSGKTQREVAALLGIGERTVRRMVAASRSSRVAALARGQVAGYETGAQRPKLTGCEERRKSGQLSTAKTRRNSRRRGQNLSLASPPHF